MDAENGRMTSAATWNIALARVDEADAVAILREYLADVASRFYGRPATPDELTAALAGHPSGHLAPPHGAFLLAHTSDGRVAGCAGVALVDAGTAEIERVYVVPAARGAGGGARLMAAAEDVARVLGARSVRLETRRDLVEAKSLYARLGYDEIPAFSEGPYCDHWFGRQLV